MPGYWLVVTARMRDYQSHRSRGTVVFSNTGQETGQAVQIVVDQYAKVFDA